MAVAFSPEALAKYEQIVAKYPVRQAAIMPVLWLAQEEFGHLSVEALEYVSGLMGFPLAWVSGVASFYTMYHKKPVGRFHLQVCTNVPCMLRGSDDIVGCLEKRLGISFGETTPNGKFSMEEVECLASCGTAPMMQVSNGPYYENLDPGTTLELIDRLDLE